ncbi:hypothetical protein [Streptosporangium sp. NPDC049046]|uniref:hypothetical protein n=1 Tax=Streptosporangium sp. NPDC049046 TaxID=3155031 RepID=UPI00341A0AEC
MKVATASSSSHQDITMKAVAVRSMLTRAAVCSPDVHQEDLRTEALAELSGFRGEFYACLTARADELFELTEALLCAAGPVTTLVDLALAPNTGTGTAPCTAG